MLTPQETVDAANDLVGGYDFNQALADYNWPNGTPLKVAWNQRHTLENLPIGLDYAQQVHQWGFGGMEIPHAVTNNPNFADAYNNRGLAYVL